LAFLTQNKAKLCKNLIITLVLEKNANFFAENCQKSQKKCDYKIGPRCVCEKIAQKVAQPVFGQTFLTFTVEISSPKMWVIYVIFKKVPKVNTLPIGENSPNSGSPCVYYTYIDYHFT
jgi:hypothetical protein